MQARSKTRQICQAFCRAYMPGAPVYLVFLIEMLAVYRLVVMGCSYPHGYESNHKLQLILSRLKALIFKYIHKLYGGMVRPAGDRVKTSGALSVIPIECSNCAERLLSRVTAVHPSDKILVSWRPALIIGSTVKIIPGSSRMPSPGRP